MDHEKAIFLFIFLNKNHGFEITYVFKKKMLSTLRILIF